MGTKIWCPGGRLPTYKNVQIPYPLISLVTQLPQSLNGYYPLTIHCRDFKTFTLSFENNADSSNVFDSVKGLTVASTFYDYSSSRPLAHIRHSVHLPAIRVQLYAKPPVRKL